jgi:hypothetical protein
MEVREGGRVTGMVNEYIEGIGERKEGERGKVRSGTCPFSEKMRNSGGNVC